MANYAARGQRITPSDYDLQGSFIELMATNPISRISIRMLCEYADVSRSTFYEHYESIYDLRESLGDRMDASLWNLIPDDPGLPIERRLSLETSEGILTFIRDNHDFYRGLLHDDRGAQRFLDASIRIRDAYVWPELEKIGVEKDECDLRFYFCLKGSIGLITYWLDKQFDYPLRRDAVILRREIVMCLCGNLRAE